MRYILICLTLLIANNIYAHIHHDHVEGIKFFQGSFEACKVEAKKQNKVIFIDFYTEWCGPCKKMAKTIFTRPEIGEYFNRNFISIKIDAEKGEGPSLAKKFSVTGYPTMIFIDTNGNEIERLRGATPDAAFFLSFAKQLNGDEQSFLEKYKAYENGDRTPNKVRDLILSGLVYISTLEREEQASWGEKIDKMQSWYFSVKKPEEMITKEDFRLISMFLGGPNNGNPYVEHIYNNYSDWAKVIPAKELNQFVVSTNNQSMHASYGANNQEWKKYVSDIKGRLAIAYGPDTQRSYQEMKMICEAGYALVRKDVDKHLNWMIKYLDFKREEGELKEFDYAMLPEHVFRKAPELVTPKRAKRMLKILEEGIEKYPESVMINIGLGDCYAAMESKEKASTHYRKVIKLCKGLPSEDYYTSNMNKKIEQLN